MTRESNVLGETEVKSERDQSASGLSVKALSILTD